jgi:hypothetical protein
MDISQSLNLNTAAQHPLFDPKFLNLDFWFYQVLVFVHFIWNFFFSGETAFIFKIILSVLAILFITVIAYCGTRVLEIREKEHKHLHEEIAEYAHHKASAEKKLLDKEGKPVNERWEKTLQDLFSPNAGDWKLAIIEADAMLDSLLDQLGYRGENLGEKLKLVDRENFHSLSNAWEAHIVRNRIAHEGSLFELSAHEAKRVIALYEVIFREFGFI